MQCRAFEWGHVRPHILGVALVGCLDMVARRAGLHFSVVNSRGELFLTTLFGALYESDRRWAVMTIHGRQADDGSFQVYGSYDVISPATR
jgi:seryl-tRNA synthetase